MATVLEQVHAALRLKSRALDDAEITPLIEACKADLRMHGVRRVDETDPQMCIRDSKGVFCDNITKFPSLILCT